MASVRDQQADFQFLSELLLASPTASGAAQSHARSGHVDDVARSLSSADFEQLKALAMTNHVIVRAFEMLEPILVAQGNAEVARLAAQAVRDEHSRIDHALEYLQQVCSGLEQRGCAVTVIKSLDHWPDLGSDLDLFTNTDAGKLVEAMNSLFGSKLAERSWGDRLASKWNFIVPGLPELVEVHVGRLGQTGEQTFFTQSLWPRTQEITVDGHSFRVLAPEDRIVISTMQRMYRHFYIRLCDVIDNAFLLDSQKVDFDYLHSMGRSTGLWEGIATYMVIISQYVESLRGYPVPLPFLVKQSAKFGAGSIGFRKDFLRVPILPHSLNLYAGELKTLLMRGQLRNSFRLSLLPGLATAAALEMKITGSDKGIW